MKQVNLKNPAALAAAAAGDFENALAASTPGGIEAQEAQGQRELVANGARLPKKMGTWPLLSRNEVNAKTGIQFGEDFDDIFVNVTLPPGWKLEATEHSMWSKLVDDKGRERAAIFYKAAFYDRSASLTFTPRYRVMTNYDSGVVSVEDLATGNRVAHIGEWKPDDYKEQDRLVEQARAWLKANHPDYADPFAYWSEA